MSIEKNLQTLADNSERIATALEAILTAISNGVAVNAVAAAPATTGAEPAGVSSAKDADAAADAENAAKAEKAKKAAAAKAAKEEAAAKAAKEAEKDKPAEEEVSYDTIKAVVTEMAGKGPDGVSAIRSVLKKYGAAKASDVPEEKWSEMLAAFNAAKEALESGGDLA